VKGGPGETGCVDRPTGEVDLIDNMAYADAAEFLRYAEQFGLDV
jgi:hypothetical protein